MIELAAALSDKKFGNTAKCFILLDHLGGAATTAEIIGCGLQHGLRGIRQWGVSSLLSKAGTRVAHPPEGWLLLPEGRRYLADLGYRGSNAETTRSPATIPTAAPTAKEVAPSVPKIFLVHGQNDGAKHEAARFIEKIGLEVVILHERPNKGRTLITKFQDEAADAAFAVVLMTGDDHGGLCGGAQSLRARQNVVFELGFFIGALGASKVAALIDPRVERPSDFEGVVYIERDAAGAWKSKIAQELSEAGVAFNPMKVWS